MLTYYSTMDIRRKRSRMETGVMANRESRQGLFVTSE